MKFKVGDRVRYRYADCPFIAIGSRGDVVDFDTSFTPTIYCVDFGGFEKDVWSCREDELELV